MAPKIEQQHMGEFLASEANGTLSRETGTLRQRVAPYKDGTILQMIGGNLAALNTEATTEPPTEPPTEGVESGDVVGILYGNYDASEGPVEAVYIARLAEVVDVLLIYPEESTAGGEKAASVAGLARLHIRTR